MNLGIQNGNNDRGSIDKSCCSCHELGRGSLSNLRHRESLFTVLGLCSISSCPVLSISTSTFPKLLPLDHSESVGFVCTILEPLPPTPRNYAVDGIIGYLTRNNPFATTSLYHFVTTDPIVTLQQRWSFPSCRALSRPFQSIRDPTKWAL